MKISTVYLTGTLSVINNVDLYFQEFLPTADCQILKPSIIEGNITQINIKDYIEVNSAIALAMQSLGKGVQSLNFKKTNALEQLKQILNTGISFGGGKKAKKDQTEGSKTKKSINISFKGKLDNTEVWLVRSMAAIVLVNLIFIIFSGTIYKQMDKKQKEIETQIVTENAEISKINSNINSLNSKNTKYNALTAELKTINDKISNIAEMKNSIPNLLNQIMHIIPENVQLVSIQNTTEKQMIMIN